MFGWFRRITLPVHKPATKWMVKPADWREGSYGMTAFYEDLPDNCYDCGAKTEETLSNPLMIEGSIQYMKRTRFCPKGCGRTDWFA